MMTSTTLYDLQNGLLLKAGEECLDRAQKAMERTMDYNQKIESQIQLQYAASAVMLAEEWSKRAVWEAGYAFYNKEETARHIARRAPEINRFIARQIEKAEHFAQMAEKCAVLQP